MNNSQDDKNRRILVIDDNEGMRPILHLGHDDMPVPIIA